MARIRFGVRNMRSKVYPIGYFSIRNEEVESYSLEYDKLDLWNWNKSLNVTVPQIEKRVNYFHIMFIPIFSTSVDWTTRKADGKIYYSNKKCKDRIITKIGKKRFGHWYFNLIPFTALLAFIFFLSESLLVPTIKKSYNRYEKKAELEEYLENLEVSIGEKYYRNTETLKTLDPGHFIEFQYLGIYGNNKEALLPYSIYARVNSINKDRIKLDFLPDQIDQMNLPYNSLLRLFKKENIEQKHSSIDSISMLIPKNIEEVQKLRKNHTKNIVNNIQAN
ncbi:hypothetical protein [Arenibacter sp. F20364]|uniref:hypothetical protein n=1 Tax=Arenibacter sp. F20364 TaxID=2926415 RepID=UPI001FF17B6C|nr:hypothetical protein [Arenibacter sp. F20364]MCK0191471.1 hypothetical protein [Arenibacter sp. F20364]